MSIHRQTTALLILLLFCGISQGCGDSSLPDEVGFNKHIRPILSDNCFQCHGPDEGAREGDLRLDIEENAKRQRDGYAAIVAGKSHKSELIRRVKLPVGDEDRMPHVDANKSLSDYDIALLEKWIDQGAEWEEHWAFVKPKVGKLPRKIREGSPAQVIDHFVEKSRQENGVGSASSADKNVLARRIAYLLTGLPPEVDDLEEFENDESPEAYKKLIDKYLASPRFGERWARHWMDVIRYSESAGHEDDAKFGGPWHYRDYLIRAFNEDVPYDQLVIEHLAGDLIETPRYHPTEQFNESIIGPTFLTLGAAKSFPVSVKQEETERINTMIDVISTSFQALSVACARCHDHKFDPIPTTDYYAMYGMLESTRITPRPARITPDKLTSLKAIKELKEKINQQVITHLEQNANSSGEASLGRRSGIIKTANLALTPDHSDTSYTIIGDFRSGSWEGWTSDGLAFGDAPLHEAVVYDERTGSLEWASTPRATSRYLAPGISGALRSPTFIVTHDSLLLRVRGTRGTMRVIVENYQPINDLLYGNLHHFPKHLAWQDYAIDVSLYKGMKAYLEFMPGRYQMQVHKLIPEDYIEAEYAIAFSDKRPDMGRLAVQDEKKVPGLSKKDQQLYASLYDSLTIAAHDSTHYVSVVAGNPVYSSVYIRGDFKDRSEEKVPHRFLTAIQKELEPGNHFIGQDRKSRLYWAKSVVDPQNPLSSRVMVNRIWHHMMGKGLVESVDNFGVQGKNPSHPELLDYLAIQFIEDGWSIKQMIRQIAMTKTFQQSSVVDSIFANKDPQNVLLHHYPVRRLEAEAIRDGVLAVSGRLDSTMYGEPVMMNYEPFKAFRPNIKESGPLDGGGRRSIYQEIRRNYLHPMMLIFDMPAPSETVGSRNVSYTPAQSLSMLNDPFFHEQAAVWAENLLANNTVSGIDERVQLMHKQAFSRKASSEELARAKAFLKNQAKKYNKPLEEMIDDSLLWTDYCHVLFNLKEFIHLL